MPRGRLRDGELEVRADVVHLDLDGLALVAGVDLLGSLDELAGN
jgi:hypothetical protein